MAFVEWLAARGGYVHPQLDLFHDFGSGHRGVYAKENIKEGEQLVLLPIEATLHVPSTEEFTSDRSSFSEAVAFLKSEHPSLSPFISTVLLLLSELARQEKSSWLPYLNTLPEDCDCLLSWETAELAELKGTGLEAAEGDTQGLFARQVLPILSSRPDLWPAPFNSFAHFQRTAGLVQSRAFHMEASNWITGTKTESSELWLLPAIDMLNHSSNPARRSTTLQKVKESMSVMLDGREVNIASFFTMQAERDIAAGEEVLHTYGDLSDGQLLQTYGFVDSSTEWRNPHNFAGLPCQELVEGCQQVAGTGKLSQGELAGRQDLLVGVLPGSAAEHASFVLTTAEPLPEQLMTAAQVLMLGDEEVAELRKVSDGAPPHLGSTLLKGDPDFGTGVYMALLKAVDGALGRYPSSVTDDQAALQREGTSRRLRNAIMVRSEERLILRQARQAVVMAMMELQEADGGDEEEGEDDDEDDDDDDDEEEEGVEGEGEGDEDEEEGAVAGRGMKRRRGDVDGDDEDEEGAGGSDGDEGVGVAAGGLRRRIKRRGGHVGLGLSVGISGSELDLLQSDDSDKVGYGDEGDRDASGGDADEK